VTKVYSMAPVLIVASLLSAYGIGQFSPQPSGVSGIKVSLLADGRQRELCASGITVAEVLAEAGISLRLLDRVSPPPSAQVVEGMAIQVIRVSRHHVTEEEVLLAPTIVLADPDSPAGYTKVLERGQDGRVRRVARLWQKDGVTTKREVIKEKVLSAPREAIVIRGTRGLPSRGGNWRTPRQMQATAYDPGPRSCGRYADGYTATGAKARKGVVAVDDRVIRMGTRLYIPGYGFAVAGDRGSAIKGNRIDLCFDTYAEARRWGRRRVKVYVLD